MQSVHRLKANELDDRFLESLKAQWGDDLRSVGDHREIEIVISEADETAYLMRNEANRQRLLKAVNDIEQRHNLVEVDLEAIL
jgi:antitoxin YefM